MYSSLTLKFTATEPLVIPAHGVTLFVGPNSSGKSLLLRELELATASHAKYPSKLVADFELVWPSEEQLAKELASLEEKNPPQTSLETVFVKRVRPDGEYDSAHVNKNAILQQFRTRDKAWIASQFLRYFQIRLDGRTRFDLTVDRPAGDLTEIPHNVLAHLFQNDSLREEIRKIVYDAFGVYFVIDPTNGGILRIRLSSTAPSANEQSLDAHAREFHKAATHIKDASDGVQAFVGILVAVRSGDFRSILVDEPEAFLHPPLARKLGYELASSVSKRGATLMASTHSSDFLIGCLQANANVRVVRLEYSNGQSKGQIVDSDALSKFFKTPLMRSANVISALFHDGVVVCESDNDRAFYAEIYYRLAEREKGYPSLLFVNAQNKQTIRDIIGPLRTFGVPAAAIVDIDILKDGGADWVGWLRAARFPDPLHGGLGQVRGDIVKRYSDSGINMNQGGVDALKGADRDAVNSLFDSMAQYGIFVTRKGQLEDWLSTLQIPGKKQAGR